MNKITIIGSGALGTSLAKVLHNAGQKNIIIFGIKSKELKELKNGKNTKYFPKKTIIPKFETTNDFKKAIKDASYIVLSVPSFAIKSIIHKIKKNINSKIILINGSKGFYPNSDYSLHTGIYNEIKNIDNIKGLVSLIGPSHAEEIIKDSYTTICSVSNDIKLAKDIQKLFSNNYFKVYTEVDVKGAEAGSAYKNILAIGVGIMFEMGMGINTIVGFLSMGINEMNIFARAIGGKTETILGLTGVGDLIATAMSDLSRNRTFGRNFVKNKKQAFKTTETIEGLSALKIIYKIAKNNKWNLPIINLLFSIIYEDQNIDNIIEKVWKHNIN